METPEATLARKCSIAKKLDCKVKQFGGLKPQRKGLYTVTRESEYSTWFGLIPIRIRSTMNSTPERRGCSTVWPISTMTKVFFEKRG